MNFADDDDLELQYDLNTGGDVFTTVNLRASQKIVFMLVQIISQLKTSYPKHLLVERSGTAEADFERAVQAFG